ncbi:FecCD family ABC transporter permease [Paenibacillus harenae]|uniref:FecCD family ABC transporter permease n=1 Tax=Paenibacillus harenae TaxID=306543 RepID=UPI000401EB4A|nr:iron ABC transporter permease [Paenibacillus harenae]
MGLFKHNRLLKLLGLAAGVLLLLAFMLASVLYGLQHFGVDEVWQAYADPDGSNEQIIITNTRVPRTFIGAVVGASLAMAGAMMQVLTRNPLASPSVFGINAGAVLFLVISLWIFGSGLLLGSMIWISFAGASVTALFVFLLGSRGKGGFEPVKLTLAGASVAAFASSVTSGIVLVNKQSLDQALFWMVGSVADREMEHLTVVLPYVAAGWALSMLLSGSLNVVALGDTVAKGLGQRLALIRLLSAIAIVLLAGGSVAVAGPIAFIGVIVPHLSRYFVGNDHRWLLPYCAVMGALLLVGADIASRFIIMPKEVPVGVATALLGVPFLIYVARRRTHA